MWGSVSALYYENRWFHWHVQRLLWSRKTFSSKTASLLHWQSFSKVLEFAFFVYVQWWWMEEIRFWLQRLYSGTATKESGNDVCNDLKSKQIEWTREIIDWSSLRSKYGLIIENRDTLLAPGNVLLKLGLTAETKKKMFGVAFRIYKPIPKPKNVPSASPPPRVVYCAELLPSSDWTTHCWQWGSWLLKPPKVDRGDRTGHLQCSIDRQTIGTLLPDAVTAQNFDFWRLCRTKLWP